VAIFKIRIDNSRSAKALHYACVGLEHLHRWVSIGIVFSLRKTGWLLGRLPWSGRLGLMLAFMCGLTVDLGVFGWDEYLAWIEATSLQEAALETAGIAYSCQLLGVLAVIVGLLMLPVTFLAFWRHRISWYVFKVFGSACAVVWVFALLFLVQIPGVLHQADGKGFDQVARNDFWIAGVWLWIPAGFLGATFLLCLMLVRVRDYYLRPERFGAGEADPEERLWGDRFLENVRTGGEDPRFRTSSYWSFFIHSFVLFLDPMLLRGCGWEEPYGIPKGSGVQQMQQKVVVIKKKKKKKFVLNMNSPIIFWRPEDTDMNQVLDQETEDQYQAMSLKGGKLGKGGGNKGGWPNGMENARVRFIRLEYDGGDWDHNMGKNADYNMLIQFAKLTGFKIEEQTESKRTSRLRHFPKHRGPPFVYITGTGGVRMSREEIQTLRWYCLEDGGMIFADDGGGNFNSSFMGLMRAVFPDKRWIDVANDDIIYRQPYFFPSGAPRFWHHSGDRATGIKHQGRWIVFYHHGDIGDAWKTGHSGASPEEAMQAYKLAVNIINYAFNQYMAIHFGDQ